MIGDPDQVVPFGLSEFTCTAPPRTLILLGGLPVPVRVSAPGECALSRISPAPTDGPPTTAIACRETFDEFTPASLANSSGSGPPSEPSVRRATTFTALGETSVGV